MQKVTVELKERLLNGRGPKYIYKGMLNFNSFTIQIKDNKTLLTIYHKDKTPLAVFDGPEVHMERGETFTFNIDKGIMKIKIT